MNKRRRNVKRVIAVLMVMFVIATTAYYGNIGPALAEAPGEGSEAVSSDDVQEAGEEAPDGSTSETTDPSQTEGSDENSTSDDGQASEPTTSGETEADPTAAPSNEFEVTPTAAPEEDPAETPGEEELTPTPEVTPTEAPTETGETELVARTGVEPSNAQELTGLADHAAISVSGNMPADAVVEAAVSGVTKGYDASGNALYTLGAFDIKVYYDVASETGRKEFQPKADDPLTVTITSDSIVKAVNAGVNDFTVYHYANGVNSEPETAQIMSKGDFGIEFKATGFSVYEVTRLQHTATYNFYCSEETSGNAVNTQTLKEDEKLTEPDLSAYMQADSNTAAAAADAEAAGTASDSTVSEVPQYVDMVPVSGTGAEAAGTAEEATGTADGTVTSSTTAQKVFKGWYYMDENGNATDQEFSADYFDQTAGTVSGTNGILTANTNVNVMGVFVSEQDGTQTVADGEATVTVAQGGLGTISNVTSHDSWRAVDSNGNEVTGITVTQTSSGGSWGQNRTYNLTVSAAENAEVGTYKIQYGTSSRTWGESTTTWADSGYTVAVTKADGSLNWDNTINGSGTTTVNFYVQLNSVIADAEQGGTGSTPSSNYTGSVYSTTISSHPTKYKGFKDGENAYVVIQGATNGSAYDVDQDIRSLATGYSGATVEGNNFQLAGFPSDDDVFTAIRGSAGSGKTIKVNGVTIDKEKLNSNDWAVRWYVFKYNSSDSWHIDGILVPKYGQMTVTKTFQADINEGLKEVLGSVYSNFQVNVHGKRTSDGLEKDDHLKLSDVTTTSAISNLTGTEVTYSWTVDVMNGSYTINESGADTSDSSAYTLDNKQFKKRENGQAETSYSTLDESGGTMNCVTIANDAGTASQACALLNSYKSKPPVTLTLTKQVTGNMGDTSKKFTFTVSTGDDAKKISEVVAEGGTAKLTEGNDTASVTAGLADDETVTLTVPYGATITITETNGDGYIKTYALSGNQTSGTQSGDSYTISNVTENTDVTVTNNRDVTIDTGIGMDGVPYVLLLGFAAAGAGYYTLTIRRKRSRR